MKKLCKNCRFWGEYRLGACNAVQAEIEISSPPNHLYRLTFKTNEIDSFGVYADADDDSGLQAELITGPEFGCNKFRSK